MKPSLLIDRLESVGVHVSIGENEKLHVKAPGTFKNTPDYQLLVQNRDNIVSQLNIEMNEQADVIINRLKMFDDRVDVVRKLHGIFGYQRLAIVTDYLLEWQQGSGAEANEIKKDNAGRYRANVWLREHFENGRS